MTCHLKQPCFYLMRGLPSAIQFNIVTSSSTLFVMALPELALKSLRVPGWNVNVIEYRHTARGARLLKLQNCSRNGSDLFCLGMRHARHALVSHSLFAASRYSRWLDGSKPLRRCCRSSAVRLRLLFAQTAVAEIRQNLI